MWMFQHREERLAGWGIISSITRAPQCTFSARSHLLHNLNAGSKSNDLKRLVATHGRRLRSTRLLGPAHNASHATAAAAEAAAGRGRGGGAHDDLVNAEDGDGGIDSETERLRLGVDMVKDGGLGAAWQAYRGPGKCYTQERALAATRYTAPSAMQIVQGKG